MVANRESYNQLVDLAMAEGGYQHMRPVIEKELLHYDVLFALDSHGLLDNLTFQGGTALRLCYGAPRFSEDLDFVGGVNFAAETVSEIKSCIEKYIGKRYGFEIHVKEPKEMRKLPEYDEIKVDKWQVRITTSPERKDLPKQKIKLEIANIPAYSREPKSLDRNYDFLPDGYSDMLIMTESLDEIMADKLVSLVSCQRYIRNRDIWDLRWLAQHGAKVNSDYIKSKINDYKEENFEKNLENRLENLDEIIHSKAFQDEIKRFIPIDVQERTLMKDKFLTFLSAEDRKLLKEVKRIMKNNPDESGFLI